MDCGVLLAAETESNIINIESKTHIPARSCTRETKEPTGARREGT